MESPILAIELGGGVVAAAAGTLSTSTANRPAAAAASRVRGRSTGPPGGRWPPTRRIPRGYGYRQVSLVCQHRTTSIDTRQALTRVEPWTGLAARLSVGRRARRLRACPWYAWHDSLRRGAERAQR